MSRRQIYNKLHKAFYDEKSDVSFSSASALIRKFKNTIPPKIIKEWLSKQLTYKLHHQRKTRFKNKTLKAFAWKVGFVHLDLSPNSPDLWKYNKNARQLLVSCDSFSRRIDAELIANKSAEEVLKGFKKLLKRNVINIVYADRGKEFINSKFKAFLASQNIQLFAARNQNKAFLAEMGIRLLRTKIQKYLFYNKTNKFYDKLPILVKSLNDRIHSRLKLAPSQINNKKNNRIAFQNLFEKYIKTPRKIAKFSVGDRVRIVLGDIGKFEKNYKRFNYSTEVFVIYKILDKRVPIYKLKDLNNQELLGSWYEFELLLDG